MMKVARFLSASFVRLGGKNKPSLETSGNTTDGGASAESEGEELQLQHGGKEAWDKEMEDKAEGWQKEWDEERQRFYYFSVDTLEISYSAPFKISVSLACAGDYLSGGPILSNVSSRTEKSKEKCQG